MTIRCRAVLLDMDGTLVDSTKAVVAQWARWAERHGIPLAEVLAISHGVPALDTMRKLAPQAATQEELDRFMQEEESHEGGAVAVQGALAFVKQLPPERWAVVTSAPRSLALMRVVAAGFPAPRVLISPEDVERGKPHPEPYLAAAERLRVVPAECFVVEDAPAGIASAHAAGMQVAAITTTYPRGRFNGDLAIASFEDLSLTFEDDEMVIRVTS